MRAPPSTLLTDTFNINFKRLRRSALLLLDEEVTNSTYFRFNNLNLTGDLGTVRISQHEISSSLTIAIDSSQLTLDSLRLAANMTSPVVTLNNGMIDVILDESVAIQAFNIKQSYGAICLSGPGTHSASTTNCPNEDERGKAITVADGEPVVNSTCVVSASVCTSSSACGAPTPAFTWNI